MLKIIVKDANNNFIPTDKLKEKEITITQYYENMDRIKKRLDKNFDIIYNAS